MGRKEGDVVDRANEEIGIATYLHIDGGRSYEDGVQRRRKMKEGMVQPTMGGGCAKEGRGESACEEEFRGCEGLT